ncbi:hypothetical protein PENVUL_c032G09560 [Penicillium vulpinum]|uniref:Actin cortical patch SUR7/pH-response regulator PalI n=1 Tax=Penicillium vulpinum TaxID=29845 RepID=A0A1V6RS20_9EURO|nr:hypothetical protein PENVUL_c032G09560 [Penicillium vulpinum]
MSDLKSLFPTVTVFIAFIITILCLFAGTQRNFLYDVDILTLRTPTGSIGIGVHDFYSIHILSHCQGTLGTTETGVEISRNVTKCSNRTLLSPFDPTEAWAKDITSWGLEWPRVISDDFHALRLTSKVMGVLYCMGIGAMGAAILLGSITISIASIIATVIAFEFVALINAHGKGSNVSAHYGEKFLGMTWAAVGLLFTGSVGCFVNVFIHERTAYAPAPVEKDIEG